MINKGFPMQSIAHMFMSAVDEVCVWCLAITRITDHRCSDLTCIPSRENYANNLSGLSLPTLKPTFNIFSLTFVDKLRELRKKFSFKGKLSYVSSLEKQKIYF